MFLFYIINVIFDKIIEKKYLSEYLVVIEYMIRWCFGLFWLFYYEECNLIFGNGGYYGKSFV